MNNKLELSGFILAGGKSKRMGKDKAFLTIQEKPMLKRAISLIQPFCQTVSISGQNPAYNVFKLSVIADTYPGCGPIAGIHSCLSYSSTDWNLIVGVDLPFLNEELINYLILNMGEFDCIIPESNSGIEPLAGLYNKQILPKVESQIQCGDFKLMNMLGKLNACFLDCNELVEKYPRLFANLNRPED